MLASVGLVLLSAMRESAITGSLRLTECDPDSQWNPLHPIVTGIVWSRNPYHSKVRSNQHATDAIVPANLSRRVHGRKVVADDDRCAERREGEHGTRAYWIPHGNVRCGPFPPHSCGYAVHRNALERTEDELRSRSPALPHRHIVVNAECYGLDMEEEFAG